MPNANVIDDKKRLALKKKSQTTLQISSPKVISTCKTLGTGTKQKKTKITEKKSVSKSSKKEKKLRSEKKKSYKNKENIVPE